MRDDCKTRATVNKRAKKTPKDTSRIKALTATAREFTQAARDYEVPTGGISRAVDALADAIDLLAEKQA